jgi:hypothetical protein
MTRWSEGAGEKQASVLAGALGAVRQAASLAELSAGSQFARLTKARVHMGAGHVFMHEIHLRAPVSVNDGGHRGVFLRWFACARPGGPAR